MFKKIVSFFNLNKNELNLSNINHFFEKAMEDNNFQVIQSMLSNGYVPDEKCQKIIAKHLKDAMHFISPHNFYAPFLKIKNIKEELGSQFSSQVSVPSEHIFYIQLVNDFPVLDEHIFPELAKKSVTGNFYNLLASFAPFNGVINSYFDFKSFETDVMVQFKDLKNDDDNNVIHDNYLEYLQFEKEKFPIVVLKKIYYSFYDHIRENSSFNISSTVNEIIKNNISKFNYNYLEPFKKIVPFEHNKMILGTFINPGYSNNDNKFEIVLNKNTGKHTPKFGEANSVVKFSSKNELFRQLHFASRNIFQRFANHIEQPNIQSTAEQMLDNNQAFSFGLFVSLVNLSDDKIFEYRKNSAKVLETFFRVNDKKIPHEHSSYEVLQASIIQIKVQNEFLNKHQKLSENINNNFKEHLENHLNHLKSNKQLNNIDLVETIENSDLEDKNKEILLEIVHIQQSLMKEDISEEVSQFLKNVDKQIWDMLDINSLLEDTSNKETVHESIQNLYEQIFKLEYQTLKDKSNKLLETLNIMDIKKNIQKKQINS